MYFIKTGSKGGGPESQEDPFIDRSFPARSKARNGGFRYRIEHSKTAQKRNVFYPVQKRVPFFYSWLMKAFDQRVYLFALPFLNTFLDNIIIILRYQEWNMKYAFAYLRVSTEEQTVQNQKLALEKWAQGNDYLILDAFEDPAISGKVPATQRRGFQEMLELVKMNGVDAVLVYELSRVGRTFWDTLDAIKAVEHYASLISCSPRESFLQTTESSIRKLMIGILTWAAERERELLVQRTKDGMERAKAAGKGIGRPQKIIDKDKLISLLAENHSKIRIAKSLGISKATLYKKLRELR